MAGNLSILCKAIAVTTLLALATACKGGTVWTEPLTETKPLDAAKLTALDVETHNGSIEFTGNPDAKPVVTVTMKGGGKTPEAAAQALAAVEVFIEPAGDAGRKVGWRWKTPKQKDWQATVSFDVTASPDLFLDVETHNGEITVKKVNRGVKAETHNGNVTIAEATGDVLADTHNGDVTTESSGGKLRADTHNGAITAAYAGSDIKLDTHNGSIKADLSKCGAIGGVIDTANGAVELVVGADTAFELKADTKLGKVDCSVPLSGGKASRREVKGTIGAGGSKLRVSTSTGNVRIRMAE